MKTIDKCIIGVIAILVCVSFYFVILERRQFTARITRIEKHIDEINLFIANANADTTVPRASFLQQANSPRRARQLPRGVDQGHDEPSLIEEPK